MPRSRNRRAFTMTEAVITLAVLAVLGSLAIPTYQGVRDGLEGNRQVIILSGYVAKARNIAAEAGNDYQYPTDVVDQLTSLDSRISSGASSESIVSAWREDSDTMVFAATAVDGRCYVVVDVISSDRQYYAYDPSVLSCAASSAEIIDVTGTLEEPNVIDLN